MGDQGGKEAGTAVNGDRQVAQATLEKLHHPGEHSPFRPNCAICVRKNGQVVRVVSWAASN